MSLTGRVLVGIGVAAAIAVVLRVRAPGPFARRAAAVSASALLAAALVLVVALLQVDGTLVYVADHTRSTAPWWIRIAGLWGGMEGSLLLFAGMLAATLTTGRATVGRGAGASATWTVVAGFGLAVLAVADPFRTLAIPAVDGGGLVPILEHPAMVWHPPVLYLGLVALAVPAAAATTSASGWRRAAQPWTLAAVALLAVAMAMGSLWSYDEVGWGGLWAWDPVENGVLVPWLVALVGLHRTWGPADAPRRGAAALAAAFQVALLATVLTRSGAAPSVHAFAQDGVVGATLLAVVAGSAAITVAALVRGRRVVEVGGDCGSGDLPSGGGASSLRLTIGIWALGSAAGLVALGTVWPVVLGWMGRPASVAADWFTGVTTPLGGLVGGLLVVWFARRHGPAAIRVGAAVAHAGILILLVGLVGSTRGDDGSIVVRPGEEAVVAGVRVRSGGARTEDRAGVPAVVVDVDVDDGGRRTVLRPAVEGYRDRGVLLARPATWRRLDGDVQLALATAADDGTVVLDAHTRPLVGLVWVGAAAVGLGGALGAKGARRAGRAGRAGRRRRAHPGRPVSDPVPAVPASGPAAP